MRHHPQMTRFTMRACVLCLFALASDAAFAGAAPVGTGFTYQGQLKQGGAPYNGTADFEIRLFETSGGVTQVAGPLLATNVTVAQGVFTVDIDFGAVVFNGDERWLQIAVTAPSTNGAGPFTTLVPRQAVKPAPYALHALSLAGAQPHAVFFTNSANQFTGVHSGVGVGLTGLNATNIATGSLATARLATGGTWALSSDLNVDSNSLVVDPVANAVGVGTASPSAPLHVQEGSAGTIVPHSNSSLVLERNNNNYLHMYAPDANESGLLFGDDTTDIGGGFLFNAANTLGGLQFRTGGNTTRMVLDATGNVGVGTVAPADPMHIVDSLSSTVRLERTGGATVRVSAQGNIGDIGTTNAFPFRLNSNNLVRMTVDTDGQVGIGTISPQAKLHVAGTAGVDGIMFPDGSLQLRAVRRATVAQSELLFSPGISLLTVPVTGAVGGSAVAISYGADLGGLIIASARVSAANTVQVRIFNTSGATVLMPASSWNIALFQ